MKKMWLSVFMAVVFLWQMSALATGASAAPLPDKQQPDDRMIVEKFEELALHEHLSLNELLKLAESDERARNVIGVRVRVSYRRHPEGQGLDNDMEFGAEMEPLGICYAPLWRNYGLVKWQFSNPGQNGAKYSVKPEWSTPLVWASPPEQQIDGIYRSSWGSCTAYKIPNAATATFHSADSWDVCYNWTACHVFGKCPGWIDPCSLPDWPNDPLW